MRRLLVTASAVALLSISGTIAIAGPEGWCLPSEGCSGPEPLTESGFNLCEESCSMSNPAPVQGMKGTLYDVSCRGDSSNSDYRMLFIEFETEGGSKTDAMMISPHGPVALERCPG